MKRSANEQRLEMERRIRIGYGNGKSVLWLSKMSGLSTQRVAEIVQEELRNETSKGNRCGKSQDD